MAPTTTRLQSRQAGREAARAAAPTDSDRGDHITVDLFHGWSTDPSEPSAGSCPGSHQEHTQVKRSLSQDGLEMKKPDRDAPPLFQKITLAKGGASSLSLSHSSFNDEEDTEEAERIKRLPPSKRPGVSHAKKNPPNHIKRPRNAYIIFRSHTVSQKLIPKEVENDHRNISRIIAHMWKSLNAEDRAYYEEIAKEEKERHKKLFPDYRYQPATRRAEVKQRNVKKLENGEEQCQEIADIILKAQGKEGVVVRPEPSKAIKRAREATRPRQKHSTAIPARKRAKTAKGNESDAQSSEQALQTVFLHASPSTSPTSGSSGASGAVPAPSPEPFRLASRTPSIEGGMQQAAPTNSCRVAEDLFGRRASTVPLLRPCSPPPPFVSGPQPPLDPETIDTDLSISEEDRERAMQNGFSTNAVQGRVGFVDEHNMPAPAWKGRRALPPPIPNTWQHCSYDDQSLPSPRSFDVMGAAGKQTSARPRTAYPSTPSSGSFRGFFHPWVDNGTESMLISPMTATFQDMRRRSSLVRSGLVPGRRPGSFGVDHHGNAGARPSVVDESHSLMPTADAQCSDAQLFEQATRAAEISLEAESSSAALEGVGAFAFDPALEGEGEHPPPPPSPSSFAVPSGPREHHVISSPVASPRLMTSSPRASFSGSTLAAAARDWASMKKRRGPQESRSVLDPVQDSHVAPAESPMASHEARVDAPSKPSRPKSALEESVERAVMLALSKDSAPDSDRGERNSKIVQQILSSLSADLSLQQSSASSIGSDYGSMPMSGKEPSQIIEPRHRSSLRGSFVAPSYRSSPYYPGSTPAAESYRNTKPLPSPLQLVMSNHEIASQTHSQSYPTSQHCN